MPAPSEHLNPSAVSVSDWQVGNYLGPLPWGWWLEAVRKQAVFGVAMKATGLASQLLPVLLPRGLI